MIRKPLMFHYVQVVRTAFAPRICNAVERMVASIAVARLYAPEHSESEVADGLRPLRAVAASSGKCVFHALNGELSWMTILIPCGSSSSAHSLTQLSEQTSAVFKTSAVFPRTVISGEKL